MRTIDADYLIKNINDWKDLLTDEKERAILEQVVHCINAKDTVIDIRKLIQELNDEKHVASVYADDADKRDAVIYNNAIDDAMNDLKLSINTLLLNQFDFDETRKLADYEPDV